jgi:hypothetical protein
MYEVSGANNTQLAHLCIGKKLSFQIAERPFHVCIVLERKSPTRDLLKILCNVSRKTASIIDTSCHCELSTP